MVPVIGAVWIEEGVSYEEAEEIECLAEEFCRLGGMSEASSTTESGMSDGDYWLLDKAFGVWRREAAAAYPSEEQGDFGGAGGARPNSG